MTDNTQSDVVEFASARRVYQDGGNWAEILTALRSDRDAVVEECARVAEEHTPGGEHYEPEYDSFTADRIAQAIRNLKGDR